MTDNMKNFISILFGIMLAIQAAAAHLGGSAHAHRRAHQKHRGRDLTATPLVQVIPAAGPTVVVYEFNGHAIPVNEVCEGIKNRTFEWTLGSDDAPDCRAWGLTLAPAPSTLTATPQNTVAAAAAVSTTSSAPDLAGSSSGDTGAKIAFHGLQVSSGTADMAGLTGYDAKIAVNHNVSREFADGQIPCSEFPSAYGAVPVDWVGIGGWSGIQYTRTNDKVVTHIDTAVAGNGCQNPGNGAVAYCSYACPAGYQKSQWPAAQGDVSMAVSVGGLMCGDDGKLHLTNPDLSKHLCIPGTGQVTVENKLSASNAICRTDYPGTESETVPIVVQKNKSSPLACPDSSTYYKHLGAATTAEYYVNMKGVSVDQACVWGTDGSNRGNWAPLVFGIGMDENGKTWLSIQSTIQNNPSSYKDLDFSVNLRGDFGGSNCFYKNGHYCSSGDPSDLASSKCQTIQTAAVPGCTVQLMSGNATYVLTD